jgi:hypothetical protein
MRLQCERYFSQESTSRPAATLSGSGRNCRRGRRLPRCRTPSSGLARAKAAHLHKPQYGKPAVPIHGAECRPLADSGRRAPHGLSMRPAFLPPCAWRRAGPAPESVCEGSGLRELQGSRDLRQAQGGVGQQLLRDAKPRLVGDQFEAHAFGLEPAGQRAPMDPIICATCCLLSGFSAIVARNSRRSSSVRSAGMAASSCWISARWKDSAMANALLGPRHL